MGQRLELSEIRRSRFELEQSSNMLELISFFYNIWINIRKCHNLVAERMLTKFSTSMFSCSRSENETKIIMREWMPTGERGENECRESWKPDVWHMKIVSFSFLIPRQGFFSYSPENKFSVLLKISVVGCWIDTINIS